MVDEVSKEEELFEDEEHEISVETEMALAEEKPTEEIVEVEGEKPVETEVEAEKSETPADKEKSEPTSVPLAALKDERHKRQLLEDEVDSLRKQIPKSDEAPDPYEDIEAYDTYKRNQWQQEQNATAQQQRNASINESRSKMLETHEDYDEMEQIFQLMTVSDKTLVDQMFASGNEAKFAYDTAKAHKESLFGQKKVDETVETETNTDKSVTDMPNLATATAQAKNTQALEREADIDDVFADIKY